MVGGGKRANSGRTGGKGISTKSIDLKLKELYDALVVLGVNKNKYINDAVSDKLKKWLFKIKKRIIK